MEWQPIETAPKDGTWIILYSPYPNSDVDITHWLCRWLESAWKWQNQDDACLNNYEPTYWMPLPEPPNDKEG